MIQLPKFDNISSVKKTYIMGIINITPDSFSKDGLYGLKIDFIVRRAEKMVKDGADIIDVGGESTRPGAKPISLKEELNRTIPVVNALSKRIKIPISIDTYKSEVAKQALDNGAAIVNDISGLQFDSKMAKVVAKANSTIVLMHIKGKPGQMQQNPQYKDIIKEIVTYFKKSIAIASKAGISKNKIILDPGIGFGKTLEHNLLVLKKIKEFKKLGYPLLIGVSRKSFIGNILNAPVEKRLIGTAASVAFAISEGINIIRVHDIKEMLEVVKVISNIKKAIR